MLTLELRPAHNAVAADMTRLIYAGFKRVGPEHEVQMDLNGTFLTALQIHKNGEGKS